MYESINMFEAMNPRYKIKKPIRLIELFAGIGSQAKALKNIDANFETYKVVEYDSNAIKSYNAIHNTDFVVQDITKINSSDLCIVDTDKYEYIMTYSFPCQDLSLAGKQKGMEKGSSTRSGLLWEVERLLKGCVELPQILLMENVPQVVGKANFKDFREWEIFLEDLGYSNYYQLLNAKDYGIPQNRNRCFMVSILGNFYYQFPCKKKLVLRLKDLLEDNVDEKYYLSEKALNGLKNTQFQCSKIENRVAKGGIIPTILARDYKDPKLVLVAQLNGFESSGRIYSEDGLAPTINTMGGGNREPKIATRLAKTLEKNSIEDGDFIDSYNQIIRKGISGTITTRVSESNNTFVAVPEKTKRGYAEAHVGDGVYMNRTHNDVAVVVDDPNELISIRKLTPKECWRLMGFSDEDFEKASKVNSNSQLYKQAGNSIVVNVLEEIFKMLF